MGFKDTVYNQQEKERDGAPPHWVIISHIHSPRLGGESQPYAGVNYIPQSGTMNLATAQSLHCIAPYLRECSDM